MAVVTTGQNAVACSPSPPANWDGWVDDTNDIFAGRVTSLTPLPVSTEGGFQLRRATIRIERLSSFEGRSGPDTVDASIIVAVSEPGENAHALCLYPDIYRPGDLVLVIQSSGPPRLFHPEWAEHSRFASLFDKD